MHDNEPFKEACRLADGQPVQQLRAADVQPDMTILYGDRWLPVKYVTARDRVIQIDLDPPEPGNTACRIVSPDAPMFRRTSAPAGT